MRDSTGALIAAYSEEFPYSGDSLQMVAQSLLKTLHFSQEAGFQKRVVEYTNSQLKALILSQGECLTELNDLLVLIREFYFSFQQLILMSILVHVIKEPRLWLAMPRSLQNLQYRLKKVLCIFLQLFLLSYPNNIFIVFSQNIYI